MKKINLSEVYLDREVEEAALSAIRSGQYILKDNCQEFEEKFAKFIGCKHAVMSNSATSVMQLGLLALGIGPGDEVITTSLTAFPTIEPIYHVGAKPVFVDIGDDYNLDPDLIEKKIGKRTKAILPVHIYGNPANMGKIVKIAKKHKLTLLEDCCQAHGAEYRGKKIGTFGKMSFFSFYPSKNLTVLGDGGMMLTNNKSLAKMVKMLRDHGRKKKYLHQFVGFNMRGNEIQAAIGVVQLKHLNEFNRRRQQIAHLYDELLADLPVELPKTEEGAVYHMYVIKTSKRDALARYLEERQIFTGVHYPVPCHLQPAVIKMQGKEKLPKTEEACKKILSLPIHSNLSVEDAGCVASSIREFFNASTSN